MTVHDTGHERDDGSTDQHLDALTARRLVADEGHRAVIRCLGRRTHWTFEELVAAVARQGWDRTLKTRPAVPSTVRLRLHHRHLPALELCGVVEWDRETGDVSGTDRVEPCLAMLAEYAAIRGCAAIRG